MVDKDAVDPTEESEPREESDVVDPEPVDSTPHPATDDEVMVEPDEFDEIVRSSGVTVEPGADHPAELDEDGPDLDGDTERVLEPAGVGAAAAGVPAKTTGRAGNAVRAPKGTATAKRDRPPKPERTGPVKFIRQSVGELRKVVYPTGQQLMNYFVVVLVFVLFIIAYVSLLDLGLGALVFKIFS